MLYLNPKDISSSQENMKKILSSDQNMVSANKINYTLIQHSLELYKYTKSWYTSLILKLAANSQTLLSINLISFMTQSNIVLISVAIFFRRFYPSTFPHSSILKLTGTENRNIFGLLIRKFITFISNEYIYISIPIKSRTTRKTEYSKFTNYNKRAPKET